MRNLAILCTIAAATLAGASLAGPDPVPTTSLCLDVGGQPRPVTCRKTASRLTVQDDICTCKVGTLVTVSYCPDGVTPPAEDRAFEKARYELAQDGSLVGDQYEGRDICVRK
ncbi:hypothetical protein QO010_002902 [Caulobacter ginsengisoli]|uniref:Secreted protein n=1 Tax=Caulobacter ginsengisoli TaxID=400775 RepID=A0ABU0IVG7_9CAUL|nr:hypothetical protein [Caulobacter ginsengisoli]MDQ0465118.1 hypothetical protein [Caulobacter ginsengisoli]